MREGRVLGFHLTERKIHTIFALEHSYNDILTFGSFHFGQHACEMSTGGFRDREHLQVLCV